jgi:predicted CoA-binding protein
VQAWPDESPVVRCVDRERCAVTEAEQMLKAAASILLIDWPSPDVPDALTRAGYTVYVKGGPGDSDYSLREVREGKFVVRHIGRAPRRVDLVYCHRPLEELPAIIAVANELGARAVWYQSGRVRGGAVDPTGCWLPEETSRYARDLVESAGLRFVGDAYITDSVRQLQAGS